eukprot:scaffold4049_cov76-Cylindrotheca_fusiformis.AAC.5
MQDILLLGRKCKCLKRNIREAKSTSRSSEKHEQIKSENERTSKTIFKNDCKKWNDKHVKRTIEQFKWKRKSRRWKGTFLLEN